MSSGTRVLLTIVGLFVGVLVLYYGFLMPQPESEPSRAKVSDPALDIVRTPVEGSRKTSRPPAGKPDRPTRTASADTADIRMGEPIPTGALPEPAMPSRSAPGEATGGATGSATGIGATSPAGTSPAGTSPAGTSAPPRGSTGATDTTTADPPGRRRSTDRSVGRKTPPPTPNAPARLPGTRDPAPPPTPAPAREPVKIHIVQSGETLSSIARQWFGDESKWDLIADANPGMNPDKLDLGQRIKLPPKTATRGTIQRTTQTTTHIVRSGETLSSIAKAYYGDATKWRKIYDANRAKLPGPDDLSAGDRLVIPGDADK